MDRPAPTGRPTSATYPDVDLVNWQRLSDKDRYERLQHVKQRWDRHDIFNRRQSIEPPG
jgi:hypothetical protein